jgi:hypothetical protein
LQNPTFALPDANQFTFLAAEIARQTLKKSIVTPFSSLAYWHNLSALMWCIPIKIIGFKQQSIKFRFTDQFIKSPPRLSSRVERSGIEGSTHYITAKMTVNA